MRFLPTLIAELSSLMVVCGCGVAPQDHSTAPEELREMGIVVPVDASECFAAEVPAFFNRFSFVKFDYRGDPMTWLIENNRQFQGANLLLDKREIEQRVQGATNLGRNAIGDESCGWWNPSELQHVAVWRSRKAIRQRDRWRLVTVDLLAGTVGSDAEGAIKRCYIAIADDAIAEPPPGVEQIISPSP